MFRFQIFLTIVKVLPKNLLKEIIPGRVVTQTSYTYISEQLMEPIVIHPHPYPLILASYPVQWIEIFNLVLISYYVLSK